MKYLKLFEQTEEYHELDNDDIIKFNYIFNMLYNPLGIIMEVKGVENLIKFNITFNYIKECHIKLKSYTTRKVRNLLGYILRTDSDNVKIYPILKNDKEVNRIEVRFGKDTYSFEGSPGISIRYSGNEEIRSYDYIYPQISDKYLNKFQEKCLELIIKSVLDISNDFSDRISSYTIGNPKLKKESSIVNNIIRRYTEYLLTTTLLETKKVPEELYKIICEEIISDKDAFKILNRIKDSVLYPHIEKYLGKEKLSIANKMSDLGF